MDTEYLSSRARGRMSTLIRLASSSKRWARWVYRETPGLWTRVGAACMEKMTDEMLAALLIRTNAKEVLQDLDLSYCSNITGVGLEPIRGSTVLRRINLKLEGVRYRDGKVQQVKQVGLDKNAIMSIVESFPPFSAGYIAPNNVGVVTGGPGILSLVLPPNQYRYMCEMSGYETSGQKRTAEKEYEETLLGLQKLYRQHFNQHVKDNPFPCSYCGESMQIYFHSPSLQEMAIRTYCTRCHRDDDIKFGSDSDSEEDKVDVGILDNCHSCKRDFDFANFRVCATCPYENGTSCGDCEKNGGMMEVCSMCDVASCSGCYEHNHYLDKVAVRKCERCKVKACGVCKVQGRCEGQSCDNYSWYCSDCGDLKSCAYCGETRCQQNGCRTSCASCNDVFCSLSEYYDGPCLRQIRNCNHCDRSFCGKEECKVTGCSSRGCRITACSECIAGGRAVNMEQCKRCERHFCDNSECRQNHKCRSWA